MKHRYMLWCAGRYRRGVGGISRTKDAFYRDEYWMCGEGDRGLVGLIRVWKDDVRVGGLASDLSDERGDPMK
jgi:hypothetical protein